MASATFNAVRALRQCAIDEKDRFPIASRAALEDFYVDDFLSPPFSSSEDQLECHIFTDASE